MKIIVSACLLGDNCKYNGGNNYDEALAALLAGQQILRVCPEAAGGLPAPRPPAELVNGVVINREGVSVDEEFRRGAAACMEQAMEFRPDLAILKSRSPSCGCRTIYDGTFSGKLIPGQGIFAAQLEAAGIRIFSEVDLEEIREVLG